MDDFPKQVECYSVAFGHIIETIIKEVNQMIKDGWIPQGGGIG